MSRQVETQFRKAATALQGGDARTAKQGFLRITKKLPDSVAAWYNLGLSYQYLDDHDRAISAFRKAIALSSGNIDAWVNLGLSQKHIGDHDSARASADKAVGLDPRHPRALNLLGTLEAERGNREAARECFEKSLQMQPDNTDAAVNLANLLLEARDAEAADRIVSRMLNRAPQDKRARVLKARVLIQQQIFDQAESILEALRHGDNDEEVLRADLALHEAVRDHFGVIEVAGKLAKIAPDDGGVWSSLGSAYFQLDSVERARVHYEKAIELDPDASEFQTNLGLVYSSQGDRDSADRCYRRALELNPGNGEAYRYLATMKRYESLSDPDIAAVEELWNSETEELNRIQLAFALGKMYDDCGAADEAFSVYKVGNDLKFRQSHFDLEQYLAHMDRITATFSSPPQVVADRVNGPQPIFVLGMPRSGTTLVEQILSRHPDVLACGELPCIERTIMRVEKKSQPMRVYPDDFKSIGRDELTSHARGYIEWVGRLHELEQPYLTDKMPFNFIHIWLIKALFPAAPVVHCRRHPLDVILSNYFQFYGSEVNFAYDLEALAGYTVRYFRLTRHWKRLFNDEIIDVDYEILVNDPEPRTRRLVEAVGLPWNEACLDQKSSSNPVRTASIWQVRQGIYTGSRERWRRYERHIGDAIEILVNEGILDRDTLQPLPEPS